MTANGQNNLDVVYSAPTNGIGGSVAIGDVLCLNASRSAYVTATDAAIAAGTGASAGVALDGWGASSGVGSVRRQTSGEVPASVSGLGPGTISLVKRSSTGRLVRAAYDTTSEFYGSCDLDGNLTIARLDQSLAAVLEGPAGGALTGAYPNPGVNLAAGAPVAGLLPLANISPSVTNGWFLKTVAGVAAWAAIAVADISGALLGDVTGAPSATVVGAISGTSPVPITPSTLRWVAATVTPMLTQAASTTGAGQPMGVIAQAAKAGSGAAGGDLNLSSGVGDGAGASGAVNIQLGGIIRLGTTYFSGSGPQTLLDSGSSFWIMSAPTVGQQIYIRAAQVGGWVEVDAPTLRLGDQFTTEAARFTLASGGTTNLTFASTVTAAQVKISDLATNSGIGAPLLLQAQNETGTTSTGGAVNISAGSGTSVSGAVNVQFGGATRASFNQVAGPAVQLAASPTVNFFQIDASGFNGQSLELSSAGGASCFIVLASPTVRVQDSGGSEAFRITPVSSGSTALQYAATVTGCLLTQADLTTGSGTGATMRVRAQNETGATSIGGSIALGSGSGTTAHGQIQFELGGTQVANWNGATASALALTMAATQSSYAINIGTAAAGGFPFTIQGQSAGGSNHSGGALILRSGQLTAGAAAIDGQLQLLLGGTIMVELAEVIAGGAQRVLSLCGNGALTSAQMPANSGDCVAYWHNAATNPLANATAGGIQYASAGAGTWRGSAGTTTAFGPA